jgi:predicted permease
MGVLYREILQKLQALPEVQSASVSVVRPVDDHFYLIDRVNEIDGRNLPDSETIRVAWNAISPGYFSTVSTPLLSGRDFQLADNENAPKVVIVNESLANRVFPDQNPIGHRLGLSTIVGVVKDSRYNGARDQPRPVLYHPLFQYGKEQAFRWGFVSYELRSRAGANLLDRIRREVAAVDRGLPIFRAKTLKVQMAESLMKERLLAMLSSFFGILALLLACIGLYGLMAYNVARRTAEIGIRAALGAPRGRLIWLIQREALFLTLAGIAVGIPMALGGARYAKSLLFEINTADPLTIVATVASLLSVATFAGYFPIRRALRIDPASALRYE